MPRLRYNAATTLDGFIASPDGSTDWIIEDPAVNFNALYAEFDTFLMGRKTYEAMTHHAAQSGVDALKDRNVVVVSREMKSADYPAITIVADGYLELVKELKAGAGRDIWLMGGGQLAKACLDAGLLDTVEVAVMPVIIGDGIKMIASASAEGNYPWKLELRNVDALESGILMCKHDVMKIQT
ncbi:bifunctional deaminase-reductase domain-containing protein [Leptodontidium sp. MPI-SDFR-AT-0119]|nr:bifunctional deaminase-reductase domain-containing protein [Leptodontidium sp. MPI-SDFR-AT-0119]